MGLKDLNKAANAVRVSRHELVFHRKLRKRSQRYIEGDQGIVEEKIQKRYHDVHGRMVIDLMSTI